MAISGGSTRPSGCIPATYSTIGSTASSCSVATAWSAWLPLKKVYGVTESSRVSAGPMRESLL